MPLSEKQRGVLDGMLLGLAISVIALASAILAMPAGAPSSPDIPARLAAALRWDFLVIACLAGGIALIARHRFVTPEDIEGSGMSAGSDRVRHYQACLQNTLEQVVLAVCTHGLWAVAMPPRWQGAVAVAAVLFLLGRILFWRGYARGAPARALGFALTFYPSLLMLLAIGLGLALGLGR
ncbi:MAPEG family protein [Pseudomonas sp. RIT-PI-AD]|uniref:MAPEG family protein n=1 Tax=Pseudomonas sp. RIT-PI-AD TaxID=3035294 RepID=UPI0021D831A1|nr:MAPEG family protein [Pseudomonas sp. RIT-PI-AD]